MDSYLVVTTLLSVRELFKILTCRYNIEIRPQLYRGAVVFNIHIIERNILAYVIRFNPAFDNLEVVIHYLTHLIHSSSNNYIELNSRCD